MGMGGGGSVDRNVANERVDRGWRILLLVFLCQPTLVISGRVGAAPTLVILWRWCSDDDITHGATQKACDDNGTIQAPRALRIKFATGSYVPANFP